MSIQRSGMRMSALPVCGYALASVTSWKTGVRFWCNKLLKAAMGHEKVLKKNKNISL